MARDYNNRKPYRTKAQKKLAKATAWQDKNGVWHCKAPVSYHKKRKELMPAWRNSNVSRCQREVVGA